MPSSRPRPLHLAGSILLFLLVFGNLKTVASNFDSADSEDAIDGKKRVLVLNSYHEGYHWADSLMSGVHETFAEKENVELYVEYMDTKRCSDPEYYELLKETYRYKYRNTSIDAIVACDDNALDFLLAFRDQIFPEVPVSFCGIVDFQPDRIEGHTNYTGVYESYDAAGNLHLIQKNHPDAQNIYVIADDSTSAKALLAHLKRAQPAYEDIFNFKYLINLPRQQLQQELEKIPENTVIIWTIHLKFPNQAAMTVRDSIGFISSIVDCPIYCLWDVVGLGVVGGRISSSKYQGSRASEIALEILNGATPATIPIKGGPLIYKLDYRQLKAHGISVPELSEPTIVINSPNEFWRKHKLAISSIIGFILFLITISLVLAQLLRRSREAEHLLKISNEQLETARHKAEESDRLKSAFINNLSHEVRTPLNGILGFIEILGEEELPIEDRQQYLDHMRTSGDRMLLLMNDLLDVSKIQSGVEDAQKSSFALNDLNRNALKRVEPLANTKQLELFLENALPDSESFITTDRGKLDIILNKLLSNAVKYTKSGSVTLRYQLIDNTICYEVEDTGMGIPEASIDVVFDSFFRLNNELHNEEEGIGLGLTIAKAFVKQLGGDITVVSEINKGSTFRFCIPRE